VIGGRGWLVRIFLLTPRWARMHDYLKTSLSRSICRPCLNGRAYSRTTRTIRPALFDPARLPISTFSGTRTLQFSRTPPHLRQRCHLFLGKSAHQGVYVPTSCVVAATVILLLVRTVNQTVPYDPPPFFLPDGHNFPYPQFT